MQKGFDPNGLTPEQVRTNREKYGANLISPPKRPSMWRLYVEKLNDPVVRVLLAAAAVSLAMGVVENEYVETLGIVVAIALATGIGFAFEQDAARKFDLLNATSDEADVKVVRDGKRTEVPRRDIVVGDVVWLETGDEVPADGVLVEAETMSVDESKLTGEPVTRKTTEAEMNNEATYPSNRVMRGTTVMEGRGTMWVDKVGDQTEIGHVARMAGEESGEPTPLNRQLHRLANWIGWTGATVAVAAFLLFFVKDVVLRYDFGSFHTWSDWLPAAERTMEYFMMAVTLVVVAVPEGLPMSVTLSLALNMRRMLATHNLVRRMHACETMGAIDVICTDKTGTLTQNQMRVDEMLTADGPAGRIKNDVVTRMLREGIAINTTAFLTNEGNDIGRKGLGNPTEVALLLWLAEQGEDYVAIREKAGAADRLPFSTERKMMATRVQTDGGWMIYMKGAPELIMARCTTALTSNGTEVWMPYKADMEQRLKIYQGKAMRTLAFAYKKVNREDDIERQVEEGGFCFVALASISDPVRSDVPEAVNQCMQAGIGVKVVTGDTSGTAVEVARQIGLWTEADTDRNWTSGADFAGWTDEEALERVDDLKIICRARPADKLRLVKLLQRRGHVVGVTGDGTNDAPALNHAHVGLSMGSGTAVAKEAGDITLMDDSFRSIGTAVMWGRSLYKNIQRFIAFQLTINLTALLVVLIGAVIGSELPLTVTQMLWVNLIMDTLAALALASLPPSRKVMEDKPRKQTDFIITKGMKRQMGLTALLFVAVLTTLLWVFDNAPEGLTDQRLTLFFTVFVMLQFWNLLNTCVMGTDESAFKGMRRTSALWLVAVVILAGQWLIVQFGGKVFRTVPLDAATWAYILAGTSIVLWVGELHRWTKRLTKKFKS